ncbi:FxsA family protein [Umezawaea beigongshangensis]|uniref:FxsA family protein n=1 Tax=Umezawaea beigongshangensis TaxID=2780383 RepID=UPI0018F24F43|nr:FxsA family protein [Umezawaea beigongshangensis]
MGVFVVLVVGMILEIAVLVSVGQSIGLLATVGLLILGAVVGSALLRSEGSRTLRSFSETVRNRREPHQEVADGVLIVAAGVLVALPGFLSDVLALFLLFPPTRRLVSRRMARSSQRNADALRHRQRFGATSGVVDGEVVVRPTEVIVVDQRQLPGSQH